MHQAAQLVRNGRIGTLRRIVTMTPKDPTLPPQPNMPVPEELTTRCGGAAAALPRSSASTRGARAGPVGCASAITLTDDGHRGAHLNDIALWGADLDHAGPVAVEGTGKYPPWRTCGYHRRVRRHVPYADGIELQCKTDQPSSAGKAPAVGSRRYLAIRCSPNPY
jgi:hypothetical protein